MSSRISRERLLAQPITLLGRQLGLAGLPFDVVQQPDVRQHDGRAHHVRRLGLEELATGVRPAGHLHDPASGILIELIVAGVGVRLQISGEVVEESFRSGPAAIGRVVVDRIRMPVVPHIGPDPAHPGARSVPIQHVDRRIVGPDDLRVQNLPLHPCIQRMDQVGTLAHPAAQGLARQLHALTPVDAFLPIQGKMVGVLRDRHLGQQARPRPSLVDRRSRLVGRHHRAPFPTGVLLTGFLDHMKGGRDVLQPLARLLADVLQLAPAFGTVSFVVPEVIDHPAAFERGRQRLATMASLLGLR